MCRTRFKVSSCLGYIAIAYIIVYNHCSLILDVKCDLELCTVRCIGLWITSKLEINMSSMCKI